MATEERNQDRIDTAPPPGATARRWTKLATFGFLMAAAGPVVLLLGGLLLGGATGDEIPFLLITITVALVGAFLVSRFGLWSKIVGVVLALGVGMMLFWTAFGLFTPASFFDFVPGLLVPPGAIIAIVGCVAAIVAARRNRTEEAAGERKTMRTVLAIVGALALISAVLTFTSRSTVDEDADIAATVTAADFEFPDTVQVSAGDTILVRNDDAFLHTFTVDDLDIDVALGPESEELIEIPDDASGTYTFYCQPHTGTPDEPGEDDMAGELTIQ